MFFSINYSFGSIHLSFRSIFYTVLSNQKELQMFLLFTLFCVEVCLITYQSPNKSGRFLCCINYRTIYRDITNITSLTKWYIVFIPSGGSPRISSTQKL